jgi:hypothetical protein
MLHIVLKDMIVRHVNYTTQSYPDSCCQVEQNYKFNKGKITNHVQSAV